MTDIHYIGIDPGNHGGIAVVDSTGKVIDIVKMPETPKDILDYLQSLMGADIALHCVLEDVGHGLPGQSSSATAKFARHNGHLDMALLALGIPTTAATPQKWMKTYSLGKSSGHAKTEWKNILKAKAQQLFPNEKLTLATCDALLIAEYARRINQK